ncbi:MAG: hypothetical protein HQM08_13570 [Candidatus Riflebacteria bacterium]|nr:hypothetical protein [Candidatus Riflebacteria bacterium]
MALRSNHSNSPRIAEISTAVLGEYFNRLALVQIFIVEQRGNLIKKKASQANPNIDRE